MNLETFTQGLANANIAIFGVPGSGKSVTVKNNSWKNCTNK